MNHILSVSLEEKDQAGFQGLSLALGFKGMTMTNCLNTLERPLEHSWFRRLSGESLLLEECLYLRVYS